jgi:hypothetical protein
MILRLVRTRINVRHACLIACLVMCEDYYHSTMWHDIVLLVVCVCHGGFLLEVRVIMRCKQSKSKGAIATLPRIRDFNLPERSRCLRAEDTVIPSFRSVIFIGKMVGEHGHPCMITCVPRQMKCAADGADWCLFSRNCAPPLTCQFCWLGWRGWWVDGLARPLPVQCPPTTPPPPPPPPRPALISFAPTPRSLGFQRHYSPCMFLSQLP